MCSPVITQLTLVQDYNILADKVCLQKALKGNTSLLGNLASLIH